MAITVVQKSAIVLGAGVASQAFSLTGVTAGNALVITVNYGAASTNTAQATYPANWVVSSLKSSAGGGRADVAVLPGNFVTAGSHSITLTLVSGTYITGDIAEISGLDPASPLDLVLTATGSSVTTLTPTATNHTTAQASEILVGVAASDPFYASGTQTATQPTGYTQLWQETDANNYATGVGAYKILSAITTVTDAWTTPGGTYVYAIAVSLKAATSTTNNAALAAGVTFGASIRATQTLTATLVTQGSPGARILTTQTNAATLKGYATPGFAATVTQTNVLQAAVAAGIAPHAAIQIVQTLTAAIATHPQPGALIRATQTNSATLKGYALPGFSANVIQTNAIRAAIAAGIQPGAAINAFQDFSSLAMLFACQQAAVPLFWTGIKPQPASFAIYQSSGTFTVPAGANFITVSATAAGGSPLGTAGRQVIGQSLPVVPGDVITITIGPGVTLLKGPIVLVSLLDGTAYTKATAQGPAQSSGIAGFGSGADAGPAYPALVVILWR